GEAGDARGSLGGDDLQALDDAGHDLVLDAGVKAFGVFANDNEVDVGITRRNVRKISYGPEVRVQLEAFAQGDIDAGEAPADRGGNRSLECDLGALEGVDQLLRHVFVVLLVGLCACRLALPVELHTGGCENADHGGGDFWPNAVAGNEGGFMSHVEVPKLLGCSSRRFDANRVYQRLLLWISKKAA